jgi:hypothetical protein
VLYGKWLGSCGITSYANTVSSNAVGLKNTLELVRNAAILNPRQLEAIMIGLTNYYNA